VIAIDTSAIIAIVLKEANADALMSAIVAEQRILISAANLVEAMIVAAGRNVSEEVDAFIAGFPFEVVSLTPAAARRVAGVYRQWGKGFHPAALNFGDCFAYDVAREHNCPLLYVGQDFARTDIESALRS